MRVTTSKSKNAESFYISKGYVNDKGVSTSVIIRKLGTLKDLLPEHGPTRDDVMVWAKEQARIETLKYKREKEEKQIKLTFHADRPLDYDKQVFYRGGYREFDSWISEKSTCRSHKTCFFCVKFLVFIYCILLQCVVKYNKGGILHASYYIEI